MKVPPALIFAVLYSVAPFSNAQSVSLEAKAITTGGKVRSKSGATLTKTPDYANNRTVISQDFWSTRDRESRVGLEIGMRNFGTKPQPVQLLSLFLAKAINGKEPFLLSAEQQAFTLGGGESKKAEAYSASATNSTERTFYQGTNPDPHGLTPFVWSASGGTAGAKIAGWIVQLSAGGKVLQTRTSSPTMDAIARDPAAMAELTRPLVESQRRSEPRRAP